MARFFKQWSNNLCMKITLEEFEKIEQSWERLNPKQDNGTAVLIRAGDNGGLNQAAE